MKKRMLFIISSIAVTIFIFSNSLQDAAESTQQSSVFVDAVVAIAKYLGIAVKRPMAVFVVRKCAHILEFAAQSFFVTLCFDIPFKKRLWWVIAVGFLTACTDECIQLFVNGRAAMVQDVFIDLVGTFVGFLVIFLFRRRDVCK